jgi:pantothenate synthetase
MLSAEKAVSSVDYAGLYDPETLEELFEMQEEMLLSVAARIGDTRLIDNMLVNLKRER